MVVFNLEYDIYELEFGLFGWKFSIDLSLWKTGNSHTLWGVYVLPLFIVFLKIYKQPFPSRL